MSWSDVYRVQAAMWEYEDECVAQVYRELAAEHDAWLAAGCPPQGCAE